MNFAVTEEWIEIRNVGMLAIDIKINPEYIVDRYMNAAPSPASHKC